MNGELQSTKQTKHTKYRQKNPFIFIMNSK